VLKKVTLKGKKRKKERKEKKMKKIKTHTSKCPLETYNMGHGCQLKTKQIH